MAVESSGEMDAVSLVTMIISVKNFPMAFSLATGAVRPTMGCG